MSIIGERSLQPEGVEGRFLVVRVEAGASEVALRGTSTRAGLLLSRPSFRLQMKEGPHAAWIDELVDAGVYQAGPDVANIAPGNRAEFLAELNHDARAALEAGGQVRVCLHEEPKDFCSPPHPAH